ncbi:MAG: RNA polymerase sigma-I factor [Acetivibrionales bacterium]
MHSVLINKKVEKIQNNEDEINKLVEEYKPFIASCTEKVTGRYVRYGEDDELSIALMAFVEAVKAYNSKKGGFLPFARNVIKRRLIDYFRKECRHNSVIPLSTYYSENEEEKDLSAELSIEKHEIDRLSEYRRMELEELKKELDKWEISFFELADASPKHRKTKKMCAEIINFLISDRKLLSVIKNKKYLPIAEIERSTGIPRKKIERSRKYILAVIIIMTGDYQYIQDYLDTDIVKPREVKR